MKKSRAPITINIVPILDAPPISLVGPSPSFDKVLEASPIEHDALESSWASMGGPHLHHNKCVHECKFYRQAMAQERDATLQSVGAFLTPSSITSALVSSGALFFTSSSVSLLATLGPIDEPPPKWVQVFIGPSLEPLLITSFPNVPPLSRLVDMLHT